MKNLSLRSKAIGLLAGLVSICIPATADDTEIYFGNSSSSVSSIHPNILFVLDTSGSMTTQVSGTGMSRLDNMKGALRTLITNTNNVNMGLMRFNRPGGAVIYPVTNLDKPVAAAAAGEVSVRLSAANDDAQQRPAGNVLLSEPFVSMGEVTVGGSVTSIELAISASSDDAEERVTGGQLLTSSADLEMMADGSTQQIVGLRFINPPATLTPTSIIDSAYIEFSDDYDSKTNTADLEISIQGEVGGDTGTFTNSAKVSSRNLTSAVSTWNVGTFNGSGKLYTVDIASVITEIIQNGAWSTGKPLTFVLKRSGNNGRRVVQSFDRSSAKPAVLKINITTGSSVEKQIVGLRFQDVGVPKGAAITSATLEFVSAKMNTAATALNITAEASGNAAAFTNTNYNLGVVARPRGSKTAVWTPAAWATIGATEQSVDITPVVQEVVSGASWCGNNAMALFLEGVGDRIANAYDTDPSSAPLLKIQYDTASVPATGTCFNKEYSYRVLNSSDDAEERSGSNASLNSSDLEMVDDGGAQQIGIRFNSVQVQQGSQIQSAYLEFTAKDSKSGNTSLTIYGHNTDDAVTFGSTSNKVSTRTKTAGVSWSNVPAWTDGGVYRSPDLTSIVQTIVNRGGWSAGNNMAFIINGSGLRRAHSMDGSAGEAPRLVIQAKSTVSGASTKTARDELLNVVDDIQYNSSTPIVGTYYEAAMYFRGQPVDFGATRGNVWTGRREHARVSHSGSWDNAGGTLVRNASCTDANLSSTSCISEAITGSPNYISPITDACQKNHIVILTDGEATYNDAESKVKNLIGKTTCADSGDEACGPELATWLNSTDQAPGSAIPGDQTITTHTIGFNFTGNWIKSLSTNGGGGFYKADTADQLTSAFSSIVTQALKSNSTFVSPAVAVNQFNRLNHLEDIYFAVFKPAEDARWDGNVKRYRLTGTDNQISDVNNVKAVDDTTGYFKSSSKSYWSQVQDGESVELGGAAENLPAYNTPRKTYTYTGSNLTLSHSSNAIHAIGATYNPAVTKAMLGDAAMSDTNREQLLSWMAGQDVLDEDGDPSTLSRQSMADPLHSKPLVFTYSGTSASPNMALLFGTNDGHFRAINASTGVQMWSFIPPELLPISKILFDNNTKVHPYGIDGSPLMWINDPDFDGTSIDLSGTNNFAYVYFGMRRGGRNYYAMDITNINNPKVLWKIEGGSGDFVELGQSWSRPIKTKVGIKVGGSVVEKDVLIFAGGYDVDQDNATIRTIDDQGRAIFIVDAITGALVWSGGPSTSGFTKKFADMKYSMPASPAVADVNGDGLADQIYIGDMGGQIWRFDILNGAQVGGLVTGGVIANLAVDNDASNTRRFYHTPDLALTKSSSGTAQINVLIGSGYHAHPLDNNTVDRFYMLRVSDAYEAASSYTAMTEASLYDATANKIGEGSMSEQIIAATSLASAKGWYIVMPNLGEKVLSSPLIIDGQVVFTTYESKASNSGCVVQPGTSREYVVDVLNATPTINLNNPASTNTPLDAADRSRTLSTGSIVDEPVIIFTEMGGGTSFLGTAQGSVNIGANRIIKTFWYQE